MPFILQIILVLSLLGFLSQIILEYIKTVRVLLFSASLLGIVVCVLAITLLSLPKPPPAIPYSDVDIVSDQAKPYLYTQEEYEALVTKYQNLIAIQPTHRDLLLNLSFIYLAQGDTTKANELKLLAQKLDPNNPFFSTN